MQYLLYDLGTCNTGDNVEVTLGYAANVLILNEENYALYKEHKPRRFTGGYIERSPYKVALPDTGHWFVIIDSGSLFSKIRALVRFIPANGGETKSVEPEICGRASSGNVVPENFAEAVKRYKLRAFLLHYYKDRDNMALPLAEALEAEGLPVFYDDFMLEPGDDLGDRIRNGIAKYKFGIVIISRAFVRIGWQASGIRCLYDELSSEYKDVYPVWHNITRTDMANFLPILEGFMPNKPGAEGIPAIVSDVIGLLWPNRPSVSDTATDAAATVR
ncbi:MAG: DUF1883 domain-containing protein [Clostridiales Family XIII bacterium]|jgi:hypothetical protein|nr:DUF1883 domain-containing protein [Clostridiales Family XIII bacterium]